MNEKQLQQNKLDASVDKTMDKSIELTDLDNSKGLLVRSPTGVESILNENEKNIKKKEEIIEEDDDIEVDEHLSDGLSEQSVNDIGTFDLKLQFDTKFHVREKSIFEIQQLKMDLAKKSDKSKKPETLSEINMIGFVNTFKDGNDFDVGFVPFNNLYEVISYFSKETTHYKSFNVIDPFKNWTVMEAKIKNKDKSINPEFLQPDYINTNNSYIRNIQLNFCRANQFQEAFSLNNTYKEGKKKYEVELIQKILEKFKSGDKIKDVTAQNLGSAYEELRAGSQGLLKDYEAYNTDRSVQLNKIQTESTKRLKEFISNIKTENDRSNKTNVELKRSSTYTAWKKKFSELINIWELYESNGLDLKFTYKYIILKKFFTARAYTKQNKIQKGEQFAKVSFFEELFLPDKDPFKALSIYKPSSPIRQLLQLVLTFSYVYTCFLIALRFWIPSFETRDLGMIESILDILFFIDMVYSVRTVYRDKQNNDVEDLTEIFKRYCDELIMVDIITIFPWEVFLKKTPTYSTVMQFRNLLKLLRYNKIGPFLAPLESTSFANIYRLLKLVIFFLIMSVWFGSIVTYTISSSIAYDSMEWSCYKENMNPSKSSLRSQCSFLIGVYQGPFIITGQLTSYMDGTSEVRATLEYFIFIFEYAIGILINTYVLGGITDILKNLNAGENFFTAKTDMLVEHMVFYDVSDQTQVDLKVYYDYLWQRHKDIIYGKGHFAILSRSLRERFENLNLPNN